MQKKATRTLTATQVTALLARIQSEHSHRVQKLDEEAQRAVREVAKEKLIAKLRKGLTEKEAQSVYEHLRSFGVVAGVDLGYVRTDTHRVKFHEMLADLRFELIMASAGNYQSIVDKFVAALHKAMPSLKSK